MNCVEEESRFKSIRGETASYSWNFYNFGPDGPERKSRRTIEAFCGQTEISKLNRDSVPISVNSNSPIIGAFARKGKESHRPEIKRARS